MSSCGTSTAPSDPSVGIGGGGTPGLGGRAPSLFLLRRVAMGAEMGMANDSCSCRMTKPNLRIVYHVEAMWFALAIGAACLIAMVLSILALVFSLDPGALKGSGAMFELTQDFNVPSPPYPWVIDIPVSSTTNSVMVSGNAKPFFTSSYTVPVLATIKNPVAGSVYTSRPSGGTMYPTMNFTRTGGGLAGMIRIKVYPNWSKAHYLYFSKLTANTL
jgi:hypothetical protein